MRRRRTAEPVSGVEEARRSSVLSQPKVPSLEHSLSRSVGSGSCCPCPKIDAQKQARALLLYPNFLHLSKLTNTTRGMAAKVKRLSGLQKEVLKLYRTCLRTSYTKPVENQQHFLQYVRAEFRKNYKLPKKEYSTIEYLLRTGYRRYEMFAAPEIKDIK